MAINREGNGYTITFAIIMVVIVGGLLAVVSMGLKPIQQANIDNEKMQNILQSIGIKETDGITRDEAGKVFSTYITRRLTINYNGEILSDKSISDPIDPKDKLDAFNIDLRKEYSKFVKPIMNKTKGNKDLLIENLKKSTDIHFPLFICEHNGSKYYIVSASGKGLWDDIWGYLCLQEDGKTLNGSVFAHKGETPGLGSKITEDWFQDQFVGKFIANDNGFTSVGVLKPGANLNEYQVDGISGATFTGIGVQEMLSRNLIVYYNFFKNHPEFSGNQPKEEDVIIETMASDSTLVSANDTVK